MRNAFFSTLTDIARRDPRIMFLTGDLGFMAVEPFRDELPRQFHNAGVSEENMVGMAAGLALTGRRVFVYSIIPFVTLRVVEFIRNDLCYHRLPVTIVGVGAGYAYSHQGTTHHAIEDLAVMRALPEMAVLSPADPLEVEALVRALAQYEGPAYLRLGKTGEPLLHPTPPTVTIGRALCCREGRDVTLLATGSIVGIALEAAEQLQRSGVSARVLSVPTVKPLDRDAVLAAAHETSALLTVEEHSIVGGLGSAVAEVLAERGSHPPFKRLGIQDAFAKVAGDQSYLRALHGLTAERIAAAARELLGRLTPCP